MTIVSQIRNHLGNTLILNTYLIMAMRLFGSLGGVVFWALATRLLTAESVGLASSAIAAAVLLAGLAELGCGYGLVRYLPQAINPARLLNLILELVSSVGLVLALLFLVGIELWSPALSPLRVSLYALVTFVLLVISTVQSQMLNWAFLARRMPVYSLTKNIIHIVLAIILLGLFTGRVHTYLAPFIAYTLANLLSVVVSLVMFLPRIQTGYKFHPAWPDTMRVPFVGYALSSHVADQFQRLPDTLMTLLVVNSLGPEVGAYFFVAWTLTTGLYALAGSVSQAFLAEGANRPELTSLYSVKSLKIGLFLATVMSLGTILFGRIFLSLYGQNYVDNSTTLLILLAISIVPGIVLPIYLSTLRLQNKLKLLLIVPGINLGMGIWLTYLFMGWFGLVGAGIGWLLSRVVVLVWIVIVWKWYQVQSVKI